MLYLHPSAWIGYHHLYLFCLCACWWCWCWWCGYKNTVGFYTAIMLDFHHRSHFSHFGSSTNPSTPQHLPFYFTLSQTIQYPFISKTQILKIRGSFPLTNWIKIKDLCPLGTLAILYNIPLSSRRSPPSPLLFLLACLAFPLTVLQHGGSIWKCFLKGSGRRCSWGPCRLWTRTTVISMHLAHIQTHTHMQRLQHSYQTHVIFKS